MHSIANSISQALDGNAVLDSTTSNRPLGTGVIIVTTDGIRRTSGTLRCVCDWFHPQIVYTHLQLPQQSTSLFEGELSVTVQEVMPT